MPAAALGMLATGSIDAAVAAGLSLDGDAGALTRLFESLDVHDSSFNIVEP